MKTPRIAIINYQAGNLRSVQKALERSGATAYITSDAREIIRSDAVVFPGQGANDSSILHLKTKGLIEPIREYIETGKYFLGICLGLQLLFDGSDEGVEPGLGILPGWVREFPINSKSPHMGWNQVKLINQHPVFDRIPDNSYFYFVHSYYADPKQNSMMAATTTYGMEFCSAVAQRNIVGVQFHPEKSGTTGLKLYENFVRIAQQEL